MKKTLFILLAAIALLGCNDKFREQDALVEKIMREPDRIYEILDSSKMMSDWYIENYFRKDFLSGIGDFIKEFYQNTDDIKIEGKIHPVGRMNKEPKIYYHFKIINEKPSTTIQFFFMEYEGKWLLKNILTGDPMYFL